MNTFGQNIILEFESISNSLQLYNTVINLNLAGCQYVARLLFMVCR